MFNEFLKQCIIFFSCINNMANDLKVFKNIKDVKMLELRQLALNTTELFHDARKRLKSGLSDLNMVTATAFSDSGQLSNLVGNILRCNII